ncbi:hypothetical protein DB30_02659 [Enhygromyxa salina]|uniref:Uncharacterized protein n=1 Tax=Enhygromyxa salina TaxID=215803 RepID=A0A0C2A7B9_9BACT|nr:hypothetical protein DB30_02659 [Enhygromyxa salina]
MREDHLHTCTRFAAITHPILAGSPQPGLSRADATCETAADLNRQDRRRPCDIGSQRPCDPRHAPSPRFFNS